MADALAALPHVAGEQRRDGNRSITGAALRQQRLGPPHSQNLARGADDLHGADARHRAGAFVFVVFITCTLSPVDLLRFYHRPLQR